MTPRWLFATLALAALLLSACATGPVTESLAAKIAVQQATLRVVGTDRPRAARTIHIVDQVRATAADEAVTISVLDAYVRSQVDWSALSLADAQLLTLLLDEVRDRLLEKMGDGLLRPEDRVQILTVLDWVEDAARLAERYAR